MRYEDDYDELTYTRKKRSSSSQNGSSRNGSASHGMEEVRHTTRQRSVEEGRRVKHSAADTQMPESRSTAGRSTGTRSRNVRAVEAETAAAAAKSSGKKSSRRMASYEGYTEEELQILEKKRQKRAEKQKKAKKRRRRLIALLVVEGLLLAGICVFVWMISKYDTIQKPNWGKVEIEHNTQMEDEVVEIMKKGYTDIMVFGVDGGGDLDGGSGGDVNMLIHINNDTGEIKLVSFYRDLYLNTGGNSFRKLTDIYRKDGALGALSALNMNLDLQIDQFVAVNWKTVAETINLLGGIDIDVPEVMMSQINGYISDTVMNTGVGSVHLQHSGYQHLDGIQTVAFCRIRKLIVPGYSMGDYGRTERQRQVIGLLLEKVKKSDLGTLNNMIDLIFPNTFTNVELKDVLGMATDVFSYHIADTAGFPFNETTSNIANSIVYSQDLIGDIDQLHTYLYGDETNYEVTQYAKDIANKLYSIPGIS